jgi:hypothetical protein
VAEGHRRGKGGAAVRVMGGSRQRNSRRCDEWQGNQKGLTVRERVGGKKKNQVEGTAGQRQWLLDLVVIFDMSTLVVCPGFVNKAKWSVRSSDLYKVSPRLPHPDLSMTTLTTLPIVPIPNSCCLCCGYDNSHTI